MLSVEPSIITRSLGMAKKQVKEVQTTAEEKTTRPVRLDLLIADIERMERVAKARGLGKAAYARQAVLKAIKEDEESDRPA